MQSTPLVSIGIPVYNEAKFIAEALTNLLAQTYPSLQILISDNASSDDTEEICRGFALKYPQITYIRHVKNLGQQGNFNYVPLVASGDYFCWAAGHDFLAPTFIADCVSALQNSPQAVLAYPRTIDVLPDGKPFNENSRPFSLEHFSPAQRFCEVMWRVDCNYVYGLWRRTAMIDSKLFQPFPAPDRVFLSEMAIKGTFVPVQTIRYCRMNRGKKQTEIEKRHRLMSYIFPDKKFTDAQLSTNEFYRPTLRGFYRVVQDAPFSILLRLRCFVSVWLCGVVKMHLFPGADMLSAFVRRLLPHFLLQKLLSTMS